MVSWSPAPGASRWPHSQAPTITIFATSHCFQKLFKSRSEIKTNLGREQVSLKFTRLFLKKMYFTVYLSGTESELVQEEVGK